MGSIQQVRLISTTVTAFDIETGLEADIAAIDDVNVTGTGTDTDPFVIEFVTPCEFAGGCSRSLKTQATRGWTVM